MRSISAALVRRIDAAEAEVAKRWLERVVGVLGDELKRQPKPIARRVIERLVDLNRNQHGDPAARHSGDGATIILRAVREVAPELAAEVDRRLGRTCQE